MSLEKMRVEEVQPIALELLQNGAGASAIQGAIDHYFDQGRTEPAGDFAYSTYSKHVVWGVSEELTHEGMTEGAANTIVSLYEMQDDSRNNALHAVTDGETILNAGGNKVVAAGLITTGALEYTRLITDDNIKHNPQPLMIHALLESIESLSRTDNLVFLKLVNEAAAWALGNSLEVMNQEEGRGRSYGSIEIVEKYLATLEDATIPE